VHYGARNLRCKRNIVVTDYFELYEDFLSECLKYVDDSRLAASLATTIWFHAKQNKLNERRIYTIVLDNLGYRRIYILKKILEGTLDANPLINYPKKEKEIIKKRLLAVIDIIPKQSEQIVLDFPIDPNAIADFINQTLAIKS
jgi:hypothetical protein